MGSPCMACSATKVLAGAAEPVPAADYAAPYTFEPNTDHRRGVGQHMNSEPEIAQAIEDFNDASVR